MLQDRCFAGSAGPEAADYRLSIQRSPRGAIELIEPAGELLEQPRLSSRIGRPGHAQWLAKRNDDSTERQRDLESVPRLQAPGPRRGERDRQDRLAGHLR